MSDDLHLLFWRHCAASAAVLALVFCGSAFSARAQAGFSGFQKQIPTVPSTMPTNKSGQANEMAVPARVGGAPDLAFAAYQRGYYTTAMQEAMKRIEADPGDAAAMTLIG